MDQCGDSVFWNAEPLCDFGDGLSLGIGLPELLLRWFRQPAYPRGNPEHLIWQDRAVHNVKFQKMLWVDYNLSHNRPP